MKTYKKVKNWSIVLIALGVAAAGCSSASAAKADRRIGSSAPAAASGTRSLAVTVPNGADEPVKVTVTTSTTTTTVIIVKPPEVIPSDLLFAFDSAVLSPEAEPALAAILAASAGRVVHIQIDAHASDEGSATYNQALSERRGQAVKDWLVGKGIPAAAITVTGWGASRPVAPNDTPESKAKNRRVSLTLTVSR